jgi:DNA-binding response OmpR family regulator
MAKILIVDEHPHNARLLQRELAAERYAVSTAATGEEALRKVRQQSPEIVVMNVMLPGINGFDVLREIKANPSTRATVVILLSARDEPGEMTYGLQLGADWSLITPFAAGDIRTLVRRFLISSLCRVPATRSEGGWLPTGEIDPLIPAMANAHGRPEDRIAPLAR